MQHSHYEELCALAVAGQLASDQLTALRQHLETCVGCRNTLADFSQVAGHVVEFSGRRTAVDRPPGMVDRFVARAHSEGIPLSQKDHEQTVSLSRSWLRNSAYALAAGLILFAGLKALLVERHSSSPSTKVAAQTSPASAAPVLSNLADENAFFAGRVDALQKQVNELTGELKSRQHALELARAENTQLIGRAGGLERDYASSREALAERDRQVASLTDEEAQTQQKLTQLLFAKGIADSRLDTQESEMNDLRDKIALLSEKSNQNQQLSAAAEEAKDLIVARHLHIVDVDDTDGNGKQERPFGRIFYAEGKNLVFYAYDLTDPRRLNAQIDFYAWGGREGVDKSVRRLGIFHPDDEKQSRWILKFSDPSVLAQINCVFVTAESNKKSISQPTGHQILFASLGPKPNHP